MCFEVPIRARAQEETLDFNTLQLRWQLRLTAGLRRTRTAVTLLADFVRLLLWCRLSVVLVLVFSSLVSTLLPPKSTKMNCDWLC